MQALKAVAVCYWIDRVLVYGTFFSDDSSLKHQVGDLMLHAVRELAAQQTGIDKILAGMYGGGAGPDRFDLMRGAKVERVPACFVLHPATMGRLMRTFAPSSFSRLRGTFEASTAPTRVVS